LRVGLLSFYFSQFLTVSVLLCLQTYGWTAVQIPKPPSSSHTPILVTLPCPPSLTNSMPTTLPNQMHVPYDPLAQPAGHFFLCSSTPGPLRAWLAHPLCYTTCLLCLSAGQSSNTSRCSMETSLDPHQHVGPPTKKCSIEWKPSGHLCVYCGRRYSRRYGLKIHQRTHTGYRPLKCTHCSRAFGDPSNLNKHLRLHAKHLRRNIHNTTTNVPAQSSHHPHSSVEIDNKARRKHARITSHQHLYHD